MDAIATLRACVRPLNRVCEMLNGLHWEMEAFLSPFFLCERSKQDDVLDVVVPESLRCLSNGN